MVNRSLQSYQTLYDVWESYAKGGIAAEEDLGKIQATAVKAAQTARNTVLGLLPMCGMDAVFEGSEINKVWRDNSVAGQNYLLT